MPCPVAPGLTMVEHTVAVLRSRCDPLIVVAAPDQVLPDALPASGVQVVVDDLPGAGPLAATGRGLRAASGAGLDWAFVGAVDMPLLTAAFVGQLAGICAADPAVEIVLANDGRDHYLAGVYRASLAGRIADLLAEGQRSMRALIDTAVVGRLALGPGASVLTNLNVPGDMPLAVERNS